MTKPKTLAVIMAAGYGTRMNIDNDDNESCSDINKHMIIAPDGKHFIDDALSFREFESESLDFAVLTRDENRFKEQNDYLLGEVGLDRHQLLYQTGKPRTLVMAFLYQYLKSLIPHSPKSLAFCRKMIKFDRYILIPADNMLDHTDLDLNDLLHTHELKGALASKVYSRGKNTSSAITDKIKVNDNNKIQNVYRYKSSTHFEDDDTTTVTSTGIYVFNGNFLKHIIKIKPLFSQWKSTQSIDTRDLDFYAYFIIDNWSGGRDSPNDISKTQKYSS